MEATTWAIFRTERNKARGSISGQMAPDTPGIGSLTRCPARAFFVGLMAATSKANLSPG